jgi:hypothetical protein
LTVGWKEIGRTRSSRWAGIMDIPVRKKDMVRLSEEEA